MMGHGYTRTNADHCVYVRKFPNGKFVILLLYVDDMLTVEKDVEVIGNLKNDLFKSFDMKDLGPARQILAMQILCDRKVNKLQLSQEKYIEQVLERFNINAKLVNTPLGSHFKIRKKLCSSSKKEKIDIAPTIYSLTVGSLMYTMVCTRLDIIHFIGVANKFMVNLGKDHWEAVKQIFRYLRGSFELCLTFSESKPILKGYVDANWAGNLDGRKSTSVYLFTFTGRAALCQSILQKCVALSTTKAEYIVVNEAGKKMLWLKWFLQELGLKQDGYVVDCDSQSAIDLNKNSMYHARSNHIEVRYHWLRVLVEQQSFELEKIHTD